MVLELPFFILLFLHTLISCYYEEDDYKKDILSFGFIFAYIVAARLSGFDEDFRIYTTTLETNVAQMIINPYYLKEWFYWIISSFLFDIIRNQYIVLLLYDLLVLFLVIGIRRKLKLPHYYVGLYFLFFPSVFGVQNIFRQHIMVALLTYSLVTENKIKRFLIYLLAVFTHNAAILFFPLLFSSKVFLKNSRSKNFFIYIASAMSIFVALTLFANYGSTVDTGFNLQFIYVVITIGLAVIIYYLQGVKLRGYDITYFLIVSYLVLLISYSAVITSSSRAERIGMITFMVILPFLIKKLDSGIKQKKLVRLSLCIAFTIPSFIFPNAIRLLVTGL